MKNILVTTDFSNKSKAGLLFAIQLATQDQYKLTFLNVHHIPTPIEWNVVTIEAHQKEQIVIMQAKLTSFVEKMYASLNIPITNIACVVKISVFPEAFIREYAEEYKFDFICISTRGAGKLERILGTNTANLINHSEVPVIAVPYNYKTSKITSILYASDLINLEKELKSVVAFSKPLQANIELIHFTSQLETIIEPNIIESAVKKLSKFDIKLNIKNSDLINSLVENIEAAIKNSKPSLLIMFTEQNRTFFQKLFLSSKSAEYSFHAKVPLLVFNK